MTHKGRALNATSASARIWVNPAGIHAAHWSPPHLHAHVYARVATGIVHDFALVQLPGGMGQVLSEHVEASGNVADHHKLIHYLALGRGWGCWGRGG